MVHCSSLERVCHAAKVGEGDFVYMYEIVLMDLGVTLPLDHFAVDVLRILGVTPSQLHPNGTRDDFINPSLLESLYYPSRQEDWLGVSRPFVVDESLQCLYDFL
ncbi:hypothetical protein CR513_48620, partial [Mucuna pruriens]